MDADYYQEATHRTAIYQKPARKLAKGDPEVEYYLRLSYLSQKLNGEAGEVAELIGKALRDEDGHISNECRLKLIKEMGDVLWYVARLSDELAATMSYVMQYNLEKLASRKERDKIKGSGDDR